MVCLARAPEGEWVSSEVLVAAANLPHAYVSKVMRRMVEAGLAEGRKGWHGGFRLAKPAHDIRFSDVLAASGDEVNFAGCAFGYPSCNAKDPCALHDSWLNLGILFRQWAQSHTLADAGDLREITQFSA